MASHVAVAFGPIQQDCVFAEGNTVADVIRFVLSVYPAFADEINDNNPAFLVGRFRYVWLNDDVILSSCGARFHDGEPMRPLPDWQAGLNIPVRSGDTIYISRMLAC